MFLPGDLQRSVGKGGVNLKNDVMKVQKQLNVDYNYNVWLKPDPMVSQSGNIDAQTINAIVKFQRDAIKMVKPDGLVIPRGRTWKHLLRGIPRNASPPPTTAMQTAINYWRYNRCISYMHREMNDNSTGQFVTELAAMNADAATKLASGNAVSQAQGAVIRSITLGRWAAQVRAGAEWDHKPILLGLPNSPYADPNGNLNLDRDKDFHFPIAGNNEHEWYYDVWSNIHYGFVGAAALFTATELLIGPSVGGIAGRDDRVDAEFVQLGIDLWRQHGSQITQEQLLRGMLERKPRVLEIQRTAAYLNTIGQDRRDWWRHLIPMHNRQ